MSGAMIFIILTNTIMQRSITNLNYGLRYNNEQHLCNLDIYIYNYQTFRYEDITKIVRWGLGVSAMNGFQQT